jgi:transmembrane sensor
MPKREPNNADDPYDLRDLLIERHRREVEALLQAADVNEPAFDADRAWEQLTPRLTQRSRRAAQRLRFVVAAGGIAAAAAVAVMLAPARRTVEPLVRQTAVGMLDTLMLTDGTRVVLDGNSRIETGADFGRDTRVVRLRGRAHFQVAADSTRPFRVIATGMVAEALGTAFTVADDQSTRQVEVVVTHGRVAFGPQGVSVAPLILTAGDRARGGPNGLTKERGADLGEFVRWTSGARRFAGAPLREVLPQLTRWFGLTVVADASLTDRRVTADWRRATAGEALAELALLLDARVVQHGDSVRLRLPVPVPRRDR